MELKEIEILCKCFLVEEYFMRDPSHTTAEWISALQCILNDQLENVRYLSVVDLTHDFQLLGSLKLPPLPELEALKFYNTIGFNMINRVFPRCGIPKLYHLYFDSVGGRGGTHESTWRGFHDILVDFSNCNNTDQLPYTKRKAQFYRIRPAEIFNFETDSLPPAWHCIHSLSPVFHNTPKVNDATTVNEESMPASTPSQSCSTIQSHYPQASHNALWRKQTSCLTPSNSTPLPSLPPRAGSLLSRKQMMSNHACELATPLRLQHRASDATLPLDAVSPRISPCTSPLPSSRLPCSANLASTNIPDLIIPIENTTAKVTTGHCPGKRQSTPSPLLSRPSKIIRLASPLPTSQNQSCDDVLRSALPTLTISVGSVLLEEGDFPWFGTFLAVLQAVVPKLVASVRIMHVSAGCLIESTNNSTPFGDEPFKFLAFCQNPPQPSSPFASRSAATASAMNPLANLPALQNKRIDHVTNIQQQDGSVVRRVRTSRHSMRASLPVTITRLPSVLEGNFNKMEGIKVDVEVKEIDWRISANSVRKWPSIHLERIKQDKRKWINRDPTCTHFIKTRQLIACNRVSIRVSAVTCLQSLETARQLLSRVDFDMHIVHHLALDLASARGLSSLENIKKLLTRKENEFCEDDEKKNNECLTKLGVSLLAALRLSRCLSLFLRQTSEAEVLDEEAPILDRTNGTRRRALTTPLRSLTTNSISSVSSGGAEIFATPPCLQNEAQTQSIPPVASNLSGNADSTPDSLEDTMPWPTQDTIVLETETNSQAPSSSIKFSDEIFTHLYSSVDLNNLVIGKWASNSPKKCILKRLNSPKLTTETANLADTLTYLVGDAVEELHVTASWKCLGENSNLESTFSKGIWGSNLKILNVSNFMGVEDLELSDDMFISNLNLICGLRPKLKILGFDKRILHRFQCALSKFQKLKYETGQVISIADAPLTI